MHVDLLLSGGTLIPVDPARSIIEDGVWHVSISTTCWTVPSARPS